MDAVRLVWQLHVRRLQHKPDSTLPHICDARQQGVDSCQDKPAVQSGQPACTIGLMGSGPPSRQYDLLSDGAPCILAYRVLLREAKCVRSCS